MVHLLTVYDEVLLQRLSRAGFALGAIPRTVFIDEELWGEACRECASKSVEDALRKALQKKSGQMPASTRPSSSSACPS